MLKQMQTKYRQYVSAPRIEVVLLPDEAKANLNVPTTLFDICLVLHLPDGQPPETIRLDDGPFDRNGAVERLAEIWITIGEKFAPPEAKR